MEYEKCYVLQPDDEPPRKKRRTDAQGLHKSWSSRRKMFQEAWKTLDVGFSAALAAVNLSNVQNINKFLATANDQDEPDRIPTGIILLEPGSSSRSQPLDTTGSRELPLSDTRIISLSSSAAPNLKTALKSINSAAIKDAGRSFDLEAIEDGDEDEPTNIPTRPKSVKNSKGRRLLAYDLEILRECTEQAGVSSLVIHLEDAEGFSGEVLSELIDHLSYWRNRIPIALLMNVSTSIDMLERRLTRAAKSKLKSRLFPAASCEEECEALIDVLMRDKSAVVIGPAIIRLIAQRQSDYLQDIASLRNSLKYVLMSAYFANPLIAMLDKPLKQSGGRPKQIIMHDHVEALRITTSFRSTIQALLKAGEVIEAKSLLEDDKALHAYACQQAHESKSTVYKLFKALEVIHQIQQLVSSVKTSSLATLYIQGLSGTLQGSASLRGLFLAVRKVSPLTLGKIIDAVDDGLPDIAWEDACHNDLVEVHRLMMVERGDAMPADTKSGNGAGNLAADLASQIKASANMLGKVYKALESEVDKYLVNANELPFHEIFLWNTTSPYREVLMPRPRQAIERALDSPHDYLDCDCCGSEAAIEDITTSNPATAVLYSLYKESGSLINVHDAWQAFQAVTGEDKEEEHVMALFQRSLAEMKHLGMVKSTRKRVDHVAKVAWPGL